MNLTLGILFAFVCALASNLGFLYKHRGACAAPDVDIRRPIASGLALLRSKWFAIGLGVAGVAWVLHVAALALAPMSVVQAVLSGGVVLLAVMAERIFGLSVGRRQWAGVACTGLGLALLAATAPHSHGANSQYSLAAMIAFESGLIVVGTLLILGPRVGGKVEHHGIMLAAAAGIMFGVSDISIKAITGLAGSGLLDALVGPWTLVTAIASVAGFYSSARGLQIGEAVPVIAVTGTAANVTCIAGGIIVFGDPLPGDALGIVLQALAFALVILAAALTPAPVRLASSAPAAA